MESNDSRPTRRSVLKATGAAFGAVGMATATAGSATASGCYVLGQDAYTHLQCPPTGSPDGPIIESGTQAFRACTDADGNQYFVVYGDASAGYVREDLVEPC